ncbi:hypothetical protein BDI4_430083 [Burkholderia diffusa]|nr:hypothetical protein BDI4_430083 [Burkholderia diffusa]
MPMDRTEMLPGLSMNRVANGYGRFGHRHMRRQCAFITNSSAMESTRPKPTAIFSHIRKLGMSVRSRIWTASDRCIGVGPASLQVGHGRQLRAIAGHEASVPGTATRALGRPFRASNRPFGSNPILSVAGSLTLARNSHSFRRIAVRRRTQHAAHNVR